MDYTVYGILRPEYWSGKLFPFPGDLPNSRIKSRSPTLQVDSLPAKPPGKPKNTAVGSLSLLQGIFLTQESNWGLLHCRLDFLPAELPEKPHYIYIYIYVLYIFYIYIHVHVYIYIINLYRIYYIYRYILKDESCHL